MGRSLVSDPVELCGDHRSESQNLAVFESQFSSLFLQYRLISLENPYGMSIDAVAVV